MFTTHIASTVNRYRFAEFLIEAEDLRTTGSSMNRICKELQEKYKSKATTLKRRWIRHTKTKVEEVKNPSKNIKNKFHGKKGKDLLTPEQEASLVTVIKTMAMSNHALSKLGSVHLTFLKI